MGYDVAIQSYQAAGVLSENLEVTRTGWSRPSEIVLIGAHYDSVQGSPGANDNASGVAALLEISREFAQLSPECSVRFVAFVNEEPPFFYWGQMGSMVYAKAARARGDDIKLMVSLEMLGCYSDESGSQSYPAPLRFFYPDRGNFIGFVGNVASRELVRNAIGIFRRVAKFPSEGIAAPESVPGIGWSDHWSFSKAGYPALMVTDTAPFRYRYYHTPQDTPEKLDYDRMARVVVGLSRVIEHLANPENSS